MATAMDLQVLGSFTSDGNPVDLDLGFVPHYFRLWNETAFDSTANPGVTKIAWWNQGMAQGEAFTIRNTNGAATDQADFLTANGIFTRTGIEEELGAVQTTSGTDVNRAAAAEFTVTAHGYATGDVVRVYGTTAMLQISGVDYVITRTGANTFTIPVDSSGFAADATAGSVRQVIVPRAFQPKVANITNITAANPAVITTANNHGYAAGEIYRLRVPTGWGMVEANDLTFEVVSVTANTITTDLDTSAGFTTFAYPTSAVYAAGVSLPIVVPVGEDATVLTGAMDNTAFAGVRLGTSVCGDAEDIIYYEAVRYPVIL